MRTNEDEKLEAPAWTRRAHLEDLFLNTQTSTQACSKLGNTVTAGDKVKFVVQMHRNDLKQPMCTDAISQKDKLAR